MREIKFRAWHSGHPADGDKQKGKFLYWFPENPNLPYYSPDPRLQKKRTFNLDAYLWNHDEHRVMQYTGLKDKNGVEIYEGDILHMAHDENAEVKWQTSRGRWVAVASDNRALFPFKSGWELCEVIGDIYENPELLK